MAQCKQNVQGKYYGTIIYNYGLHEKLISIIIELRKYLVIGSTGKSAPISNSYFVLRADSLTAI